MKTPVHLDSHARFSGRLRHYHRASGKKHLTWDEWVDGASEKPASVFQWTKTVIIAVGGLTLCGIIVGLIVGLL